MSRVPTGGVPKPLRHDDNFIREAPGKGSKSYPWLNPSVRNDVEFALNSKLREALYLKLDFLSYRMSVSKRKIVEDALQLYLDNLLKEEGIPTG